MVLFICQIQGWLFGLDQMHVKTCSKVWCTFREGFSLLGLGKLLVLVLRRILWCLHGLCEDVQKNSNATENFSDIWSFTIVTTFVIVSCILKEFLAST